jgi:hypothetical protein
MFVALAAAAAVAVGLAGFCDDDSAYQLQFQDEFAGTLLNTSRL